MPTLKHHKKRRAWEPDNRIPHERRRNPNQQLYNSKRWRKLRLIHLKKNPLCAECKRQGIITPANMVDHVVPYNEGGKFFDPGNLESLCDYRGRCCHEKKCAKESQRAKGGGVKP